VRIMEFVTSELQRFKYTSIRTVLMVTVTVSAERIGGVKRLLR